METTSKDVPYHFQQTGFYGIQTNADRKSLSTSWVFDHHSAWICKTFGDVRSPCLHRVILITNRFAGSIILAITYGYDASNNQDDTFISQAKRVIDVSGELMTPERAALLAAFPICEPLYESIWSTSWKSIPVAYMPSWLPGGQYKQRAGEIRSLVKRVLDDPFKYVRDEMVCWTFDLAIHMCWSTELRPMVQPENRWSMTCS